MTIKIGIAGFGKIGQVRAYELEKNENSKVVAVFDVNKIDKLDNNIKIVESFAELLNQDIDAVFICAFNNVLADFTCLALKAGKHVFCEKPPARSTKELKSVRYFEKALGISFRQVRAMK